MSAGYITPGTSLTAAHWNDIFQAADAQLTSTLGGLSALLCGNGLGSFAGVDLAFDRTFFFFDPLTVSAATLHPSAQAALAYYWSNRSANQQVMFLRNYNHGAITSLVAGLTVLASTGYTYGVQLLQKPSWSAWSATIYPSGFGSYSTANMFSGTTPADNILDCSLGVIRVNVSGTNYAVTFKDLTTAEHVQPLRAVDIFINGTVSWDSAWDKYSVVRVHNCGTAAATIFGTSIKAGASRCFRKISGSWQAQGNYFHWMPAGAGRFLGMMDFSGGAASIFNPGIVADVLQRALRISKSNFGAYVDPLKMWDASPVLNNASYTPTRFERIPPSGGYFASLGGGSLLGDLLVHRGKVMAYRSDSDHPLFDFTGFTNLASALAAAGVSSRTLVQNGDGISLPTTATLNNLEIYSSNGSHLVDCSSPLATLLKGIASTAVGASQTSTPKSLLLPWLAFSALDIEPATNQTNYYFKTWGRDNNGNFITTGTVTVKVNNATETVTVKNNAFLPTNSCTNVFEWVNTVAQLGGVIAIQNYNVLSTTFGPVLQWDEVWPLNAGFSAVRDYFRAGQVVTTKIVADQSSGNALRVTRSVFIGDTLATPGSLTIPSRVFPPRDAGPVSGGGYIFGPPNSQFLKWNFPRVDQQYQVSRWFYHDPAKAPMMPDWSTYFHASHYTNGRFPKTATVVPYLVDGFGNWGCDDLDVKMFNVVVNFYETTPIGTDVPTPGPTVGHPELGGQVFSKTGIARCGAWTSGTDAWGPFAAWMNGAGTFTWCVAPDLTGAVNSVSLHGYNLVPAIESGSIADPDQVSPNVLRCQAEHFNALASLVNAQPPARGDTTRFGFGSTYFPVYKTAVGNSGLSLSPVASQLVWPRRAFFCWNPPASGPDPVATYLSGLGCSINSTAIFGTSSTASVCWISIDDARALYGNFSVPFSLDVVGYPVSWQADATLPNGGDFVSNSGGDYLVVGFAYINLVGSDGLWHLANGGSPATDKDKSLLDYATGIPRDYGTNGLAASALVIQREGLCDLCAAAIPYNFAYKDKSGVPADALAALGAQIIPIIADNSVEASAGEVNIISGAGGAGNYETIITTGLTNAVIQLTPIDGWTPPPAPGGNL